MNEQQSLRLWCIENNNATMSIFDMYEWLDSVKGEERKLRKFCITCFDQTFKTPAEQLEWILNGAIPVQAQSDGQPLKQK